MVLLGWEFPVYNTSEDVNTMEICAVLLGNATLDDILIFNLLAEDGTATGRILIMELVINFCEEWS